jgi:hypothetical protein
MIEALQVRSPFARAFFNGRSADFDNPVVLHLQFEPAARFASKTDGMFDLSGHFSSCVYQLK